MAKFIYQEIGGITNKGETIIKPRFVGGRQVSTEEFINEVAHRSVLSRGTLLAALTSIADLLPQYLAKGNTVRLEGIGLFTPTLTMRDDRPVSEADGEGNEVQHNARNVVLDTVRITPDRELVSETRKECRPVHDRFMDNQQAMSTPFTREERLHKAIEYLETVPMLTVAEYMRLTGLRHTMAANELRSFATGPDAQLKMQGRGSHRYYTR